MVGGILTLRQKGKIQRQGQETKARDKNKVKRQDPPKKNGKGFAVFCKETNKMARRKCGKSIARASCTKLQGENMRQNKALPGRQMDERDKRKKDKDKR